MKPKRRRQSSAPAAISTAHRLRLDAAEQRLRRLGSAAEIYGALARVVVPMHAEMCVLDAIHPDGVPRLAAILHADPAKDQFVRDSSERYPLPARHPVYDVIATRAPFFWESVDDGMLERMAVDETHLAILRRYGPRSLIGVPIEGDGRVVAVLTLALTTPSRRFTAAELGFATQLGARATLALDALVGQGRLGLRSDVAPAPRHALPKPDSPGMRRRR
jgi:GAF domain-containing protein